MSETTPGPRRARALLSALIVIVGFAAVGARADAGAALAVAVVALASAVALAAGTRGTSWAHTHLIDLAALAVVAVAAVPPGIAPVPTDGHGHPGGDAIPVLVVTIAAWAIARGVLLGRHRGPAARVTFAVTGMCLATLLLGAAQPVTAASASVASATVTGATTSPSST